ncbi:MAG: glycosyltransferase family 9 protein [Aquabacterium sp.]
MSTGLTQAAAQARHILFIRLDNLGDVLMCTPAMQAVRDAHPHARLTLLTSPSGARLAPHLDMLDEVWVHRAAWVRPPGAPDVDDEMTLIERLRSAHVDVAVVFTTCTQSALPVALLCRMAGIACRVAFSRENPYALLSAWIPEEDTIAAGMRHEVLRQLALVAQLGVPVPANPGLRLKVRDADRIEARAVLAQAGLAAGRRYVLLHPGATAASRRYRPHDFGVALSALMQAGWSAVICGSEDDREAAAQVRAAVKEPVIDVVGALSLGGLAALIEDSALLMANNSGPAHMAAAVGTPLVCLYALTNPQHTPWQVPSRVLFQDVPCRHCLRSTCPQGHHACLRGVAPEAVVEAALGLLNQHDEPHARSLS